MKITDWTELDAAAADEEGWNIWSTLGSMYGPYQLQRNDEDEIFPNDEEAAAFVKSRADGGSPLHIKALQVLLTENPAEYEYITTGKWPASWPSI